MVNDFGTYFLEKRIMYCMCNEGETKVRKGKFSVLSLGAGMLAGAGVVLNKEEKKQKELRKMSDKNQTHFLMMNQWVKVKQGGKNLTEYFEQKGIKNIAIYGLGYAGETLIEELKETETCVKYGIDKNASSIHLGVEVYSLDEKLPEVDAVVVTPVYYFDQIEEDLCSKFECPIISLEDILYEV